VECDDGPSGDRTPRIRFTGLVCLPAKQEAAALVNFGERDAALA